jgi:hypothetical protein
MTITRNARSEMPLGAFNLSQRHVGSTLGARDQWVAVSFVALVGFRLHSVLNARNPKKPSLSALRRHLALEIIMTPHSNVS